MKSTASLGLFVGIFAFLTCFATGQKSKKCPSIPSTTPVHPRSECEESQRNFNISSDASNSGDIVVSKLQDNWRLTRNFTIAPGETQSFFGVCGGTQYYLEAKDCHTCFDIYVVPSGAENMGHTVVIPSGTCSSEAKPPPAPKPQPAGFSSPNIVVMLVDDIGSQDFGFNGAGFVDTPVLDNLVKKSLHFIAGWATPLCLTTRALIMTGKLPYVTNWFSHKNPPPPEDRNYGATIGNLAQEAGYRTFFGGKWQIPGTATGSDGYGFDEYMTIRHADGRSQEDIYKDFDGPFVRNPDGSLLQDQNRYAHPIIAKNGVVLDTGPLNFSSNMIVDEIHSFMRKTKEDGKKSFVWWPSPLAHKDYDQESGTPSAWAKMPILNNEGVVIGYDESEASFPKMINYMDTIVGLFIDGLKRDGLYEDTLFIFTSDNGSPDFSERSRPYKAAVFDERGVLVPVLFHHGGGLVPAKETKALFSHADIYATVAGFMKQPISPPRPNSYDFSSFVRGETTSEPRKWVFSFQGDSRMIRTGQYFMNGAEQIFSCQPSADIAACAKVDNIDSDPSALAEKTKMLNILDELESTGFSDAGNF